MTSLVTGACGFIGSAVARELLVHGHTVRALVRPISDTRNLEELAIEVAPGDLTDRASLARAVAGCDALFHVAADYRMWVRHPQEMYKVNVDGTRDLMAAAAEAGVKRIVYTSSVATLGLMPDATPADEETPVSLSDMIGHYKRSKFLAEAEVTRLYREQRLPVVIVNPSTPVGPRDIRPTPTGRMIADAAAGRIPAYVDTGLNLAHVDDVAAGHRLAFERGQPGERYILGGENLTLCQILSEIARISGRKAPRVRLPVAPLLPIAAFVEGWTRLSCGSEPLITVAGVRMAKKMMFFSSTKAERQLGYVYRDPIEGLRDAVMWFREHGYCP